jgi:hypothetical protein
VTVSVSVSFVDLSVIASSVAIKMLTATITTMQLIRFLKNINKLLVQRYRVISITGILCIRRAAIVVNQTV